MLREADREPALDPGAVVDGLLCITHATRGGWALSADAPAIVGAAIDLTRGLPAGFGLWRLHRIGAALASGRPLPDLAADVCEVAARVIERRIAGEGVRA